MAGLKGEKLIKKLQKETILPQDFQFLTPKNASNFCSYKVFCCSYCPNACSYKVGRIS